MEPFRTKERNQSLPVYRVRVRWDIADGRTPGHVLESAFLYWCVRRSSALCVILIGRIRESAGQHFSNRGGHRGGAVELP